jgi:hypothetical protein
MNLKDININDLRLRMLVAKVGTLMYYLSHSKVKKYYGCDYEFDVEADTGVPIKLHTWLGKDHKYQEKYHKTFDVPEHLKIPIFENLHLND